MTNGSYEIEYAQIRVKAATRDRLLEFKVHPNQSFDEVINRLMDMTEKPKEAIA